jgi:SulP family sulfate permease
MVSGVVQVAVCVSYALMIFSGDLSGGITHGVSVVLVGGVLLNLIISLRSSTQGITASPQDGPAAIGALMAVAIAASMPKGTSNEALVITVVTAIVASTLLTGLLFYVLGHLKVGGLVRYIPYPVIGGFLAGTGWLLFQGSLNVMAGASLSPSEAGRLFESANLLRWLPGVGFGLVLFFTLRRYKHYLVLPSMLALAVAAFFVVLFATGGSTVEAGREGWLLPALPTGSLWKPLGPEALHSVQWGAIFGQAGNLATIAAVSLVQFLLYVSGLEVVIKRDMDLERELQVAGFANIATSLGGGMAGFHWPTTSILTHKMGVRSRLVGVFAALLFAVVLLAGASFLSFFPKLVLGGILTYLGLTFLVEWVYDAWFKLPTADYLIVLLILVVIGTIGFLEGVAVGMVAAVILFVIKYSRIRVVKSTLTGASYQSNLDRPPKHQEVLDQNAEQMSILKLQGFLFFGTADKLYQTVRERADRGGVAPLEFAILDFRHVSGLDSSAMLSFEKMIQLAVSRRFYVVFTNLTPQMAKLLNRGGLVHSEKGRLKIFDDLDHGVEWCEEIILFGQEVTICVDYEGLRTRLARTLPKPEHADALMGYLEKHDFADAEHLMRQGRTERFLYIVEKGWVTVMLELDSEKRVRLRTMGAGTVVGETGLYMNAPRTASVVADGNVTAWRLSGHVLKKMEKKDPQIAASFHHFMVTHLAQRLVGSNRTLRALLQD